MCICWYKWMMRQKSLFCPLSFVKAVELADKITRQTQRLHKYVHVPTTQSKGSLSQKSDTSEHWQCYTAENTVHKVAYTGDGQNNGHTTQYRTKIVYVGCIERTLVVSIFHYSFVCLYCLVSVSMHYRLCLVTVCMKVLQKLETCQIFKEERHCWWLFSWSICNQNGHSLGVSRAAV